MKRKCVTRTIACILSVVLTLGNSTGNCMAKTTNARTDDKILSYELPNYEVTDGNITKYTKTPLAITASQYTLTANNQDIFVENHYEANQARLMYDGKGEIQFKLKITGTTPLTQFDIYPRRENVYAVLDEEQRELRFTITPDMYINSQQYIISITGVPDLILMIDPPEEDKPNLANANVYNLMEHPGVKNDGTKCTEAIQEAIDKVGTDPNLDILYIPNGYYQSGRLVITEDNVAIYLEEGVLIKGGTELTDYPNGEYGYGHNDRRNGSVFIHPMGQRKMIGSGENATYEVTPIKNFKLYGRGVIDGSGMELEKKWGGKPGTDGKVDNQENWIHLFEAKDVDGLIVKDVIMRNSSNWCFKLENTNDAEITNVKAINSITKMWSDGMDLSSVTNAVYNNNLSYSHDDAIAIMTLQLKNEGNTGYDGPPQGPTENVTFNNHLGWSPCSAVRIGWDSTDQIKNIAFNNCEFVQYGAGGLNMHRLQYNNKYGDIVFKDCRWNNADQIGNFMRSYGTDGNGFSSGAINAEKIRLENCIIDGRYKNTWDLNGNSIDRFELDSVLMSTGKDGLVRKESDIHNFYKQGKVGVYITDSYNKEAEFAENRYQAECTILSRGGNLSTSVSGYDGFGFARGMESVGASSKFTIDSPIATNHDLNIRYSAVSDVKNLALYVNGVKIKNLFFEGTGEYNTWETIQETVALQEGKNTIEIRAMYNVARSIYVDYIDVEEALYEDKTQEVRVFDTLEAEYADVIEGSIKEVAYASQTRAVELSKINDRIQYGVLNSDSERMVIRYQAENDTSLELYHNTDKIETVSLPRTGSGIWNEITLKQKTPSGCSLSLLKAKNNAKVLVDYIIFEVDRPALTNMALGCEAKTNVGIASNHWQWYGVHQTTDGSINPSEIFKTIYNPAPTELAPHEVVIDLGKEAEIYDINLYVPTNYSSNLVISAGMTESEMYVISDKRGYSFSSVNTKIRVPLNKEQPFHARFIKVSAVSGGNLQLGEVEVMGIKVRDMAGPNTPVSTHKNVVDNGSYRDEGRNGYSALVDYYYGSRWQGKIPSETKPAEIVFDLNRLYTVNAITPYITRYVRSTSMELEVLTSLDNKDYVTALPRQVVELMSPSDTHNALGLPYPIRMLTPSVGRYVKVLIYNFTQDGRRTQPEFQELEVNGDIIYPTEMQITADRISVPVDDVVTLQAIFTPANTTNKYVSWSSEDVTIATVNEFGEVRGVKDGVTKIVARSLDGNIIATCNVFVGAAEVDSINIKSVSELSAITVSYPTNISDIDLPEMVEVILEDEENTKKMLPVQWDTTSYVGEPSTEYKLTGEIMIPSGSTIINKDDLKASITIVVGEKETKNIKGLEELGELFIAPNIIFEELELPSELKATLEDGSSVMLGIKWGGEGYSNSADTSCVLTGEVVIPAIKEYYIANPDNLKASVKVNVLKGELKNLTPESTVTTKNTIQQNLWSYYGAWRAYDKEISTNGMGLITGWPGPAPSVENPHEVLIDLECEAEIHGINVYRTDKNYQVLSIYAGMTEETMVPISLNKKYQSNGAITPIPISFDEELPFNARFIKILCTESSDGSMKLAEIEIMGIKLKESIDKDTDVAKYKSVTISQDDTIRDEGKDGVSALIDNNPSTKWTGKAASSSNVRSLQFDLKNVYELSGIVPEICKYANKHVIMEVLVSEDGQTYEIALPKAEVELLLPEEVYSMPSWPSAIAFDKAVKGRYVTINIYSGLTEYYGMQVIGKQCVEAPKTYPITVDEDIINGSIRTSEAMATEGTEVTVVVDPEEGFRLKEGTLKVNQGKVELIDNKFIMPDCDVSITAEFEIDKLAPIEEKISTSIQKDGSIAVTIFPKVNAVNGRVEVTLNDNTIATIIATAVQEKADVIIIEPKIKGYANSIHFNIAKKDIERIEKSTGAMVSLSVLAKARDEVVVEYTDGTIERFEDLVIEKGRMLIPIHGEATITIK